MDKLSDAQLAVAPRVNEAIKAAQDIPINLLNRINGLMQSAWATGYAEVFGALGDRAAALESQLGALIGLHLVLGGDFAALPKPPVCYIKCVTGEIVPTSVPFPAGGVRNIGTSEAPVIVPLARWSIPAANAAAANALVAAEAATPGAILAALIAAQPSA